MSLIPDVSEKLPRKTILDPYGRVIGRIVGVHDDSSRTTSFLRVELSSGGFLKCRSSQIAVGENSLTLNDSWKIKANRIAEESTTVLRKTSALKNYNESEAPKEVYSDLLKKNDAALRRLTSDTLTPSDSSTSSEPTKETPDQPIVLKIKEAAERP